MKRLFSPMFLAGLGILVFTAGFTIASLFPAGTQRSLSFEEAQAFVSGRYVKPSSLSDQIYGLYGPPGPYNLNTEIDYALPADVLLYNIVPMSLHNHVSGGVSQYQRVPLLEDINGDGLKDMLYSYMSNDGSGVYGRTQMQYLLLNNGHGFDIAYLCQGNSPTYRGDCAAP